MQTLEPEPELFDFDPVAAVAGRDEGIARAKNKAERTRPGWLESAMLSILAFPRKEFRVEELRQFAYAHGLDRPPSQRAWGAVIMKARRESMITFVRYEAAQGSDMHRQPVSLWKKT